ncbi:uncharacterized protein EMH_0018920 [Eimeria mitis]|uniref:Uncharacterized protein n=1 Tax=Eimeria mitis TaxID=44415 RepID=U6K850_9EIME|nr:uncharacterized protein EMH_0018920 [Eimeria mitis]CDJ34139.1 hypothetical protein, conserved [Eimeria mitis]
MADYTPEEQFSLLSQQLLLLNQVPQQDDAPTSLEAAPSKPRTPLENPQNSPAAVRCNARDKIPLGHTSLDSGGPLADVASMDSQAFSPVRSEVQGATNVKSQRIQQMQMTLLEHQSQLLRQREQLQQQQRLLLQRSQERNVAPHSLAQLFSDLHEARQQQYLQTQQRTDHTTTAHTSDARAVRPGWRHHCSKSPNNGGGLQHSVPLCVGDGVAGLGAKREGKPSGEQLQEADPELEHLHLEESHAQSQQKRGEPRGQGSADRRRLLRNAGLLNARALLSCTLGALRSSRRDPKEGSTDESFSDKTMQCANDNGSLSGCQTYSEASGLSASTPTPWGARNIPHGSTGGKVIQVHGEPLPLTVLCPGIPPGKLWLHCLRVTLHARRCAIRTRRYWKALVHLFPRRSAYSTMVVLSEEDLKKYKSIRPRGHSSQDTTVAIGSWLTPKEPFCDPGLYCLIDERGPILAAWAVARGRDGRLRRCSAVVGKTEVDAADEAVVKRKRSKSTENASKSYTAESSGGEFSRGKECVEAEGLQALEKWYVNVANEPLTEQQIRSLTLAEYASAFGEYADCLVSALQSLVETRHAPSYAGKACEGCGCSCSICVGQPCRVRLAWRQHLMAFELAIDKTAAARSRSDSSGEESVGSSSHGTGRNRTVATLRSRKGRWEWCRRCPLGCRMQLHLILHELYQPLSLTKPGLRSALAQMLMRLRRYVTLSPLGVELLMQRLEQIRLIPASGAGFQDAFCQAKEGDDDELNGSSCSWATRDWAQACWHRRKQRLQTDSTGTLIGSNNLDSSVARLSMLSTALWETPASNLGVTEPGILADGGEPERGKQPHKSNISADELQAFADGMARQDCSSILGGASIHTLRLGGLHDVVTNPDDEEEGARSPQYSYPISIASSQVPSACSTPPRQSSRPRLGRCFAVPRSAHSQQVQGSDGAFGYLSSGPPEECGLSAHSDGTGRAGRGGTIERDDLGRPGHGRDGLGGDALDASPRRIRRMQRARLTPEDQQTASGRRRVTPLVPWWWEDYVKTGAGQGAPRSDSRDRRGDDAASDSSSSVNSTISLAASPHVFRIPCGSVVGAPPSTSAEHCSWQTNDTGTGAMLARFTEAVDSQSRSRLHSGTDQASSAVGDDDIDLSVELIHAAAELVDSIESWPVEFGAQRAGEATKAQSHGVVYGERTDGAPSECTLPTSEAATLSACAPAGRKAKPPKGHEGTASPSNTEGMLTFVSAVLSTPTDNEIDSLNGFELLQGALRALLGSTTPVEGSELKAIDFVADERALERVTAAQQGSGLPADHAASVIQTPVLGADVAEDSRRRAAEALVESAHHGDNAPVLDANATTPLLRSLAASSAPAVESTQGQLLVDDFYALPLLKGAVCYRDAHEPFDTDYTDVQIRLKPMRAFGRRQDRHSRHRRRSWRLSSQSAGSSPRGSSPAPSRPQATTGLGLRKPIQASTRGRGFGPLAERTGTVKIGGRRVVVRTVDDGAGWASREPSAGGLSDFSLSRCIEQRAMQVLFQMHQFKAAALHKARVHTKAHPATNEDEVGHLRADGEAPAWLGDDEGGDIDMEQPEGFTEPSGNSAGKEEAKSTAAAH